MFSQLAKKQKQTEVKGQKPPKKPKLDEDEVPKPKPQSRGTKVKTMPDGDEISDEELIQISSNINLSFRLKILTFVTLPWVSMLLTPTMSKYSVV